MAADFEEGGRKMSNEKMIDVIMVEPMRPPGIVSMRDNTKAMQEAVGGEIEEYMPFDDDIAIVCNQEGKHLGLPLNRTIRDENGEIIDVIAGTFFIRMHRLKARSFCPCRKSFPESIWKSSGILRSSSWAGRALRRSG